MYDLIERVITYLNQSGEFWQTMSDAVYNNSVVIIMYALGCLATSLSFYLITLLLVISVRRKGFLSTEHKKVATWFLIFLISCGTSFGAIFLSFFYAFYWVYSGVIVVTGVVALCTVFLYIKYFRLLDTLPSAKTILQLQTENIELKKKTSRLKESLNLWSENIEHHISSLKTQYFKLSEEIHQSNPKADDIETEDKTKIVDALSKIKEELALLINMLK